MVYKVLVTCNDGKRDYAIERLKEFRDIKNIQQRKNQNEVLAQIASDDKNYVLTNIIHRIQAIDGIKEALIHPL